MSQALPILYSFRRCPYAMRARMALNVAGVLFEHREVLLRDKPLEMINASSKATVPVLVVGDMVLDESLDIMLWALGQNDPDSWLEYKDEGLALVSKADDDFKNNLDKYKYASRHAAGEGEKARDGAIVFLKTLEKRLEQTPYLFGLGLSLADIAIFPFVRQFANVDRGWFDTLSLPHLIAWLKAKEESLLFHTIMEKKDLWEKV